MAEYYIPFEMDRNADSTLSFRLKIVETPLISSNESKFEVDIQFINSGDTVKFADGNYSIEHNGSEVYSHNAYSSYINLKKATEWSHLKSVTYTVAHDSNGAGLFKITAKIRAQFFLAYYRTSGTAEHSGTYTAIDLSAPTLSDFSISADRYGLNAKVSFTAKHSSYSISKIDFKLKELTWAQTSNRIGKATAADQSYWTDASVSNQSGRIYSLVLQKLKNLNQSNDITFDLDAIVPKDYPLDSGANYAYELVVTAENRKIVSRAGTLSVPQKVTGVSCDSYLEIQQGSSDVLIYNVLPANAELQTVSIQSTDPTVATVSDEGYIEAISEGICQIVVTTIDGNFSASCNVTVLNTEQFPQLFEIRHLTVRDIAKISFACSFLGEKLTEKGATVPELADVVCKGRNHPIKEIRLLLEAIENNCQILKNASFDIVSTTSLNQVQSFEKQNSNCSWYITVNEWISFLNELNSGINNIELKEV